MCIQHALRLAFYFVIVHCTTDLPTIFFKLLWFLSLGWRWKIVFIETKHFHVQSCLYNIYSSFPVRLPKTSNLLANSNCYSFLLQCFRLITDWHIFKLNPLSFITAEHSPFCKLIASFHLWLAVMLMCWMSYFFQNDIENNLLCALFCCCFPLFCGSSAFRISACSFSMSRICCILKVQ